MTEQQACSEEVIDWAVALESTDAMNNAGTGHAAYCELNYTPQQADGTIETSKALAINASYEVSLSLWSPYHSRIITVGI